MNLKYILIAVPFVGILFFVASCSVSSVIRDGSLEMTLKEFNDAFRTGDVDKLSALTTEDYTHTNGAWKSFGKDQWLKYMQARSEQLSSGNLTIATYEMDEVEIKYLDQAALVTFRINTSGIENDQPFNKSFRVTTLWVLEVDRWLRLGFHDTQIE